MRWAALPSWLVAGCAALVVIALAAFVVTNERQTDVVAAGSTPDDAGVTASAPPSTPPPTRPGAKNATGPTRGVDKPSGASQPPDRPVERRTAYVEVYNNSGIAGLAGATSAVLQDTGWRVVTTDNWYGEIPADTVYFPARLEAQARLLARDLGVGRLHVAVAPMSFDRITVILTSAA